MGCQRRRRRPAQRLGRWSATWILIATGGVIAGSSTPAVAQEASPGFSLGAQLGLAAAHASYDPNGLVPDDAVENQTRWGGSIGVTGRLTLDPEGRLSVGTGMLYQMKGGKTRIDHPVVVAPTVTWKLDYLTVPLTARVALGPASGPRPFFLAGTEMSVKVAASLKSEARGISAEEDLGDTTRDFDFALLAGAGVDFPFGEVRGFVQAEYAHGLIDANDPSPSDFDVRLHNRTLSLSAGVELSR